jgi:hypothetical protein
MNTLQPETVAALIAARNPDGGWGYQAGGSWTEPTALALLALRGQAQGDVWQSGVTYLRSVQRSDGGWPPRASVNQSTWVTALALLSLGTQLSSAEAARAVRWIEELRGEDSGVLYRLRQRMLGLSGGADAGEGWPWFPETAAWVMPTSLTILALQAAFERVADARGKERVARARKFLWSRACRDGGWNHGSTRALGYEANSYPETTGVALAALKGDSSPQLPAALATAERQLAACRSSSARSWLRIGLAAHGRIPASLPPEPPMRGCMDRALYLLAEKAAAGQDPLQG